MTRCPTTGAVGVGRDTLLHLHASRAIAASSVTAATIAVRVDGGDVAFHSSVDARDIVLTPDDPFPSDRTVTVVVDGVLDDLGRPLFAPPTRWTFTTGERNGPRSDSRLERRGREVPVLLVASWISEDDLRQIVVAFSTDGGRTFTPSTPIAAAPFVAEDTGVICTALASAGGSVVMTHTTGHLFNWSTTLSTSNDGGKSFGAPNAVDAFTSSTGCPQLALAPSPGLYMAWQPESSPYALLATKGAPARPRE